MKGEIAIKPLIIPDMTFVLIALLFMSSFVEMYDTKNKIIIEPKQLCQAMNIKGMIKNKIDRILKFKFEIE